MRKLSFVFALALAALFATPHDAGAVGPDIDNRTPVNPYGRKPDGSKAQFAVDENGYALVSPGPTGMPVRTAVETCTDYGQSVVVVGTTAVPVPASPRFGRKLLRVCNSPENIGTPKVKCLLSETAPVMGATNRGDVLTVGDCFTYQIASAVPVLCISDTAGTAVTTFECTW